MSGPSPRRLLRTVWAGAVAAVAARGLLFAASVHGPASHLHDGDRELSAQHQRLTRSAGVDQARAVPREVNLEQIAAVLESTGKLAREQGRDLSPAVAHAAAELGMLYTTNTMQQVTFDERTSGVERPAPEVVLAVAVSYGEHASAVEPGPLDPSAGYVTYDQIVAAAVRLSILLDASVPTTSVEVQRADPLQVSSLLVGSPGLRERPGSSLHASLLDVVTMFGGSTQGYANGRIPVAALCPLAFAPGHMLRCDAAERLTAFSDECAPEFGYPIPITDSYRTYVQQVVLAGIKPHLAAVPGTSDHGWGLAVDLSELIAGGASRECVWLRVHGPDYGWDNPSWARPDGTKPEPWHFDFLAAGALSHRAVDPSDISTWGSADPFVPSGGASPRDEPEPAPEPKDGSPAGEVQKPPTKPEDEPSSSPPPRPSRPVSKPAPCDPKPKPPTTRPVPSPVPTPVPSPIATPVPTPIPTPSPVPSPTPSEPSQEPSGPPTPTPSQPVPSSAPTPPSSVMEAPHAPSSDPSASTGPLSGIVRGLGLAVDDAKD
jgi:hypothetical protein